MFPRDLNWRNSFIIAFDSDHNDWNNKDQQDLYSDLSGANRELVSADDMDISFEPSFVDKRENSKVDNYRSNGLEDNMSPLSVIIPQEKVLSRQKRSVTWMFGSTQTFPMDGSGTSIEGSKHFLTVYI